ncbi:translation initiation factor IF-3, C-terminal domain-containing protein [Zychaea mexicana]|uniref:translation initiation factor IF-3, C-terminal domain-containing protein n=1 Tax=Zychaea mexicana TaxID=64656 RepID=UPI0022FECBEF|nr:translation initiation factor IF-3, C-terminal domain-containing protein [Zychaea mexicana]KAI9492131.1 translation initiation factor IF-3, C-terminal domain-containing protein [Zychaea mexicana]
MYRALTRQLRVYTRLSTLSRVPLSRPQHSAPPFIPAAASLRSFISTTRASAGAAGQSESASKPMGRPRRDEKITARFITFIDEKGQVIEQRGRLNDILRKFDRSQYFLMEVQPGKVPVCRLFDKKAMFEKQKQKKKSKQAHPEAVVKEIVFGWNVSEHDMEHKLARAKQFLEKGNKVKIEIVTKKGQQRLDKEDKTSVVDKVAEHMNEYKSTKKPVFAGGNCIMQFERK